MTMRSFLDLTLLLALALTLALPITGARHG
jgi:hypothetical protein